MRRWPEDRLAFGGDYNPEQWPRETWTEDVDLMARAGVSFVTLGVFSWSWLEPAKGEYEFGWLDDVMDLHGRRRHRRGPGHRQRPPHRPGSPTHTRRSLPVDHDGHTLWPGSRQAWCPTAAPYREHALALTTQLATRYHDHPALAMWHVSNEYACHNVPCYCDTCAGALPRLAPRCGTSASTPSTTRGAPRSGASATPTGSRYCRRGGRRRSPTRPIGSTTSRFQSDELLDFFLAEKSVLDPPLPRRPGHDELHDHDEVPAPRLPPVGTTPGRRQHRPLRRRQPHPSAGRARVQRRPDPRAGRWRPVDADGALDVGGQLAAGQPRQGARPDDPRQPRPRRSRRRHDRLLPVAPVAGRIGEVPLRTGAPRGPGLGAVPGGLSARRDRRAAGRGAR